MTLYKAETANIVVSDGSINNGTGLPVTVSPLAVSKLALAAATTTPTAGAADNLTITAQDTYGNTVPSYNGSHDLTFSGAGTVGGHNPTVTNTLGVGINFGAATAISFTNGVATVSANSNGVMTLYKAETANIVVSDGTHNNGNRSLGHGRPANRRQALARSRDHDTDRGRDRQPDHNCAGHLRQHGHELRGLA